MGERSGPKLTVYGTDDYILAARAARTFEQDHPDGHLGQRRCVVFQYEDGSTFAVWRTWAGATVVYGTEPPRVRRGTMT